MQAGIISSVVLPTTLTLMRCNQNALQVEWPEVFSMGTNSSGRTEHPQSTLQESTTISSDPLETGDNDLKDHLGDTIPYHDSTTLTDGAPRTPTAHDGEQDKVPNVESLEEFSTSTNAAGPITQPQSVSQEHIKTSFDVPESSRNDIEDSPWNLAQQQDSTNSANGNPRISNAYSGVQDPSDTLGYSTAHHEDSGANRVQEQNSTTSINGGLGTPIAHIMNKDRRLSLSKASRSGLIESVSDPRNVIENELPVSTPNIAKYPQVQGMIPGQLDGQTDLNSRHERLRPYLILPRRHSDFTDTEHEGNFNSDAEEDRASATTSADRGFSRLGVSTMTLDPPMTPSVSSTKNTPNHQTLAIVPAIPRIFERRSRPRSSVVGESLQSNGGPVQERKDERSVEERSVLAVQKVSYAATEATMVNQESSSVDPEYIKPLSCSSSPPAPMTDLGHENSSSGTVEGRQASSSERDLSASAEAIRHRKSSSVDAEKFRPRGLKSPRTPTKHPGHRKSFSPLAPEFYPSRNSSLPSTPSNLGQPVHSRNPSGGSGEPTHVDHAAGDTVRGARDQQHGHPTSTYHNRQGPQPYPGPTPAMLSEALTLMEPAGVSNRRLSPALDMHPPQSHLAPWQINSKIGNAYLVEQNDNNSDYTQPNPFESYATSTPAAPTPNPSDVQTNAGLYATDTNGFQSAYFTNANSSNQIV